MANWTGVGRLGRGVLAGLVFGWAIGSASGAAAQTARFIGTGSNWFDPANWSTGAVPDADTDVLLPGGVQVVIDPAQGSASVTLRDLTIEDGARLTTLPGTIITDRNEFVSPGGQLLHFSTESSGEGFFATGGVGNGGGVFLNPTVKSRRIVVLQSSFTSSFGLGGAVAAGPGMTGEGFHASFIADQIAIAGQLETVLLYGFMPTVGDMFQIITAGRATGQFDRLPENAWVARYGDVALRITYAGGDGNDVELRAVAVPEPASWALMIAGFGMVGAVLRRQWPAARSSTS